MEMVERIRNVKDNKPVVVMPLGDIQWTGDPNDIALSVLHERIETGLSLDALFVGMGDYIDYASPSNRREIRSAKLYDNTRKTFDRTARWMVDDLMAKVLWRTKGRWLGMLEGHHFADLDTGITSDQYLCEQLEARFLGSCAYIGLHFKYPGGAGIRGSVAIWAHHGAGGSQTLSGPITKLEKVLPDWEADIYLIGHMTKQPQAPANRLYPAWTYKDGSGDARLRHYTKVLVGTGGFAKGYIEKSKEGNTPRGTYVEKGMMRPAVLGSPIIRITPKIIDRRVDGRRTQWFRPEIRAEMGG